MNSHPYRYILRYYIDPGFHEEERIAELVEFCRAARIAEVMFFHNPEELFTASPSEAELSHWLRLARHVRQALARENIAMSVNPWTTTIHVARGRSLGPGRRNFRRMVGEDGSVSPVTACPLCPEWQRQLSGWFARIATEVAPCAIWIEDDWRLHNHEPSMGFGGCFCEEHLRRFAAAAGCGELSRKTLLHAITSGNNLIWRRQWLELSSKTLLAPAAALAEAVRNANPAVRLGLMSSDPDAHSIEGRKWQRYKEILSPDAPLLLRPHLPPYTERHPFLSQPAPTRHTVAFFPPGSAEIVPELENSPRCGVYSKSHAYSAWECLLSPLYGSCGITINHYDMMGNGIALDPEFRNMLAALRPRLDALAALGAHESNLQGIDVLVSETVAAHAACRADSLLGLVNSSAAWSRTLGILGISHRITASPSGNRPVAVSGQTLRSCSDVRLKRLLSGLVLLDGDCAAILCERGFGSLIGLAAAEPKLQVTDGFAYEEICEDDPAVYSLSRPRMSAQRSSDMVYRFELLDGCEILTEIHRFDRSILYPGMIRFRNRLGGTVCSVSYPLERGQFYMGFFNCFRAKLFQRLLTAETGTPLAAATGRPMLTYLNRLPAGSFLLTLANPLHDPVDAPTFQLTGLPPANCELLNRNGRWKQIELIAGPAGSYTLRHPVLPLETLNLRFDQR